MDNEIQLISDGDGLTAIGNRAHVEHFLASMGLLSSSTNFRLERLGPLLRASAGAAQAASEIAANSARWLKLTKESAQLVEERGLMESKTQGISYAMVGKPGSVESWLQVVKGPGPLLTNPAFLAGAAGIMAQLATQLEMSEIKSYLATLVEKVDDVLRAHKNAELAKVFGAGLDIESAMAVLERTRQVDDDTWSTVQARNNTITDALGWVLGQLDSLVKRVESKTKISDLAKTVKEAESEVQELLAVAARCFELQDALDVLRLERALNEPSDKLDELRLALKDDRQKRRELITQTIEHLMERIDAAATTANSNVLLHLPSHRALVVSINHVIITINDFHRPLGIESGRHSTEARRWWDAARDSTQLKNAAAEAGRKAAIPAGAAVVGAVLLASRAALSEEESGEQK